jgi:hypothetical protein
MNINDFEDMVTEQSYTFRWHTERRHSQHFDEPDTAFLIEVMKDEKVLAMYDAVTIRFIDRAYAQLLLRSKRV